MVNDSVREELASKISPLVKSVKTGIAKTEIPKAEFTKAETPKIELPKIEITKVEIKEKPIVAAAPPAAEPPPATRIQPSASTIPPPAPAVSAPSLSISTTRPHTAEFTSKPTSPTLVEFQSKNAVIPEWRLQLQNSVRRRSNVGVQTESSAPTAIASSVVGRQTFLATSGATALKTEQIEQAAPVAVSNPTLEKAMRRIEASRQKYHAEEEKPKSLHLLESVPSQQARQFPYVVAPKPPETAATQSDIQTIQNAAVKLKAAPLAEVKAEKFDTNKLPPLPAKVSSSFEKTTIQTSANETETKAGNYKAFQIETAARDAGDYEKPEIGESAEDEADDRAPVSLRFNAGLFDLIIGSFLSVILLAPFMLSNGNLFTFNGLLAFLATCSIVMFIYLTTTIGTMGKTFGMRLFSLEIVDIEQNAYPTFHQAAVSSSIYLISLAFGGIGFLTLFLNHENRAAHDLLSGTIVVKEYE